MFIFADVFSVKHFKTFLEVVTCKIKHLNILQRFCKCFTLRVTTVLLYDCMILFLSRYVGDSRALFSVVADGQMIAKNLTVFA